MLRQSETPSCPSLMQAVGARLWVGSAGVQLNPSLRNKNNGWQHHPAGNPPAP